MLGLYMPDAITTVTVNGVEHLATANEGDGRSFSIWTTNGVRVFDSGSEMEHEMLSRNCGRKVAPTTRTPSLKAVTFGVVNGLPMRCCSASTTSGSRSAPGRRGTARPAAC
ncbi:MAG: hypothetical protein NXI31_17740 [bacterium]|nr:hypothetical protein [bacterium]